MQALSWPPRMATIVSTRIVGTLTPQVCTRLLAVTREQPPFHGKTRTYKNKRDFLGKAP